MSYRALGAGPSLPQVASASITPWGKTQPQLPFSPGWPMTLPATWDAQGTASPGVTEVRPGYAKFGKLSMPESDWGSTQPDPPPGSDPRALPTMDCFDRGERRIDFNPLWDGKYAELAGLSSLLFFKEDRMRRLLKMLTSPQAGFKSGLDALAYDASLTQDVSVAPKLEEAVNAARAKFDSDFPKSRWQKGSPWSYTCQQGMIDQQWSDPRGSALKSVAMASGGVGIVGLMQAFLGAAPYVALFEAMMAARRPAIDPVNGKCPRGFVKKSDLNIIQKAQQLGSKDCVLPAKIKLRFDTYVDPKNALSSCVGKIVLAAPSVQGPHGGFVSGVAGIHSRRIPVWVAVEKKGQQLVPTAWFSGFLNCILGKPWSQ